MVLKRGILLGGIGLGIGLCAALGLGRFLEHTLRGISGADPIQFRWGARRPAGGHIRGFGDSRRGGRRVSTLLLRYARIELNRLANAKPRRP
jgi:hypothetical protein